MKPTCDAAVEEEVHKRMSPPNRESIPEIARCTGMATSTDQRLFTTALNCLKILVILVNVAELMNPAIRFIARCRRIDCCLCLVSIAKTYSDIATKLSNQIIQLFKPQARDDQNKDLILYRPCHE
jgi:hypothetical protein